MDIFLKWILEDTGKMYLFIYFSKLFIRVTLFIYLFIFSLQASNGDEEDYRSMSDIPETDVSIGGMFQGVEISPPLVNDIPETLKLQKRTSFNLRRELVVHECYVPSLFLEYRDSAEEIDANNDDYGMYNDTQECSGVTSIEKNIYLQKNTSSEKTVQFSVHNTAETENSVAETENSVAETENSVAETENRVTYKEQYKESMEIKEKSVAKQQGYVNEYDYEEMFYSKENDTWTICNVDIPGLSTVSEPDLLTSDIADQYTQPPPETAVYLDFSLAAISREVKTNLPGCVDNYDLEDGPGTSKEICSKILSHGELEINEDIITWQYFLDPNLPELPEQLASFQKAQLNKFINENEIDSYNDEMVSSYNVFSNQCNISSSKGVSLSYFFPTEKSKRNFVSGAPLTGSEQTTTYITVADDHIPSSKEKLHSNISSTIRRNHNESDSEKSIKKKIEHFAIVEDEILVTDKDDKLETNFEFMRPKYQTESEIKVQRVEDQNYFNFMKLANLHDSKVEVNTKEDAPELIRQRSGAELNVTPKELSVGGVSLHLRNKTTTETKGIINVSVKDKNCGFVMVEEFPLADDAKSKADQEIYLNTPTRKGMVKITENLCTSTLHTGENSLNVQLEVLSNEEISDEPVQNMKISQNDRVLILEDIIIPSITTTALLSFQNDIQVETLPFSDNLSLESPCEETFIEDKLVTDSSEMDIKFIIKDVIDDLIMNLVKYESFVSVPYKKNENIFSEDIRDLLITNTSDKNNDLFFVPVKLDLESNLTEAFTFDKIMEFMPDDDISSAESEEFQDVVLDIRKNIVDGNIEGLSDDDLNFLKNIMDQKLKETSYEEPVQPKEIVDVDSDDINDYDIINMDILKEQELFMQVDSESYVVVGHNVTCIRNVDVPAQQLIDEDVFIAQIIKDCPLNDELFNDVEGKEEEKAFTIIIIEDRKLNDSLYKDMGEVDEDVFLSVNIKDCALDEDSFKDIFFSEALECSGNDVLSPEEKLVIEKAIEAKGALKVGDIFHAILDDEDAMEIEIVVKSTNIIDGKVTLSIHYRNLNVMKSEMEFPICSKEIIVGGVSIHELETTTKVTSNKIIFFPQEKDPIHKNVVKCVLTVEERLLGSTPVKEVIEEITIPKFIKDDKMNEYFFDEILLNATVEDNVEEIVEDILSVIKVKDIVLNEELFLHLLNDVEELSLEERLIIENAIETKGALKVGDIFHAILDDEDPLEINILVTSTNIPDGKINLFISYQKPTAVKSEVNKSLQSKEIVIGGVSAIDYNIGIPQRTVRYTEEETGKIEDLTSSVEIEKQVTPNDITMPIFFPKTICGKTGTEFPIISNELQIGGVCVLQNDRNITISDENLIRSAINIEFRPEAIRNKFHFSSTSEKEVSELNEVIMDEMFIKETLENEVEEVNEHLLTELKPQDNGLNEELFLQVLNDGEELSEEERFIIEKAIETKGALKVGDIFHAILDNEDPLEIEMTVTSTNIPDGKINLLVNYHKHTTNMSEINKSIQSKEIVIGGYSIINQREYGMGIHSPDICNFRSGEESVKMFEDTLPNDTVFPEDSFDISLPIFSPKSICEKTGTEFPIISTEFQVGGVSVHQINRNPTMSELNIALKGRDKYIGETLLDSDSEIKVEFRSDLNFSSTEGNEMIKDINISKRRASNKVKVNTSQEMLVGETFSDVGERNEDFNELTDEERLIIEKAIESKGSLRVGDIFHAIVDKETEIEMFVKSTNIPDGKMILSIQYKESQTQVKSEINMQVCSKEVIIGRVSLSNEERPILTSTSISEEEEMQEYHTQIILPIDPMNESKSIREEFLPKHDLTDIEQADKIISKINEMKSEPVPEFESSRALPSEFGLYVTVEPDNDFNEDVILDVIGNETSEPEAKIERSVTHLLEYGLSVGMSGMKLKPFVQPTKEGEEYTVGDKSSEKVIPEPLTSESKHQSEDVEPFITQFDIAIRRSGAKTQKSDPDEPQVEGVEMKLAVLEEEPADKYERMKQILVLEPQIKSSVIIPQPGTVQPEKEDIELRVPVVEDEPTEEHVVTEVISTPESLPEEERSVTPPLEYGLVVGMSGSKIPQPETVEPEDEYVKVAVLVVEEEPTEEDGVIDMTLAVEPFPGEERPLTPALEYGFVVRMSSSRIPQPETVEPEDECIDVTVPVVEEEPTEEDGVIDVTLALEPFPGEERPVTPALHYGLVVGMSGTMISQPGTVQPEKEDMEVRVPVDEDEQTEEHVVTKVILSPEPLSEEDRSVTPPLEYGLVVRMSGSKIPQPETVEPEDEYVKVTVPVVEEEPTEEDVVIDVTLVLEPFPGEEKPVTPALEYGFVVGMSGSRIPKPETVEPEDECIDVTVPVVEEEPTEEDVVIDVTLVLEPFPGEERPLTPALEYGLMVGMSGTKLPQPGTVQPEKEDVEVRVPVAEEEQTEEHVVTKVILSPEPLSEEDRSVTPPLEYGLVVRMSGSKIPQPETVEPEDEDLKVTVPVVEEEPTEEDGVIDVTLVLEPFPGEERPVTPALEYGLVVGMSGTQISQPGTVQPEKQDIELGIPLVEAGPTEEHVVNEVILTPESLPEEERSVTPPLEYGFVVGMSGTKLPLPQTAQPEKEDVEVRVPVAEEEQTEEHVVTEVILALELLPEEEKSVTPPLEYGLVVGMSGSKIPQPETVEPEDEYVKVAVPVVEEEPTEEDGVIDVTLALEPFPGEERPLTPALEYGLVVGMSGRKIPQPETVEPEDECIDVTVRVVEEEPTEEDGVIDVTLALEPFPGEERPLTPALEYGLVVGMSGTKLPLPQTAQPEKEDVEVRVPVAEEEQTEEHVVTEVILALELLPEEERSVTPALEYGLVVGMSGRKIPQPETVEPEDECIDVTEPVVEEEPTEEDGVIDVTLALEPFPAEERPVTSALEYGLVVGMSGTQISQPEIVQPEKQDIELGIPLVEAGPTEEHVVNEVILTPESLPEEEKSVTPPLEYGLVVGMSGSKTPQPETVEPEDECIDETVPVVEEEPTEEDGVIDVTLALDPFPDEERPVTPALEYGLVVGMSGSRIPQPETVEPEDEYVKVTVPVVEEEPTEEDVVIDVTLVLEPFPGEERPLTPALEYGFVVGMSGSRIPKPETVEPEDECIDVTVPVVEEEPTEEHGVIDVTLALEPFPGEERPLTPALEYGLMVGMSGTKLPQPGTVQPEKEDVEVRVPVAEEEQTEEHVVTKVILSPEPLSEEDRSVTPPLEYGLVVRMSGSKIPQPETVEPEDEDLKVTVPVVEEEPTEEDGVIDVTLVLEPFPGEERPVTPALEYGLVVGMSGTQISQPGTVQPEKQDIELGIPLVEAGPTEEHVVNEVILTPESLPEEERSVTPPLEYGFVVGMSGTKLPLPQTAQPEKEDVEVRVPVAEEEQTEEHVVTEVILALELLPEEEKSVTPPLEYGLVVGMSGSKIPQPETVEPEDEYVKVAVPVVEEEPTEEDGVIDVTLALEPFPGEERPLTPALEYGLVVGMSGRKIPQPETVEPEDECIDVTVRVVEEEPTEEDGVIDVTLALEPFPGEERPLTPALEYGLVVGMSGTKLPLPQTAQPEKEDVEVRVPVAEEEQTEEHVVTEVILALELLPEEERSVTPALEYGLVVGMSGRKIPQPETVEPEDECIDVTEPVVEEEPTEEDGVIDVTLALEPFPAEERPVTSALEYGLVVGMSGTQISQPEIVQPEKQDIELGIPLVEAGPTEEHVVNEVILTPESLPEEERSVTPALEYGLVVGMSGRKIPQPETVEPEDECIDVTEPVVEEEPTEEDGVIDVTLALEPFPAEERPVTSALEYGLVVGMSGTQISQPEIVQPEKQDIELGIPLVEAGPTEEHVVTEVILALELLPEEEKSVTPPLEYGLVVGMSGSKIPQPETVEPEDEYVKVAVPVVEEEPTEEDGVIDVTLALDPFPGEERPVTPALEYGLVVGMSGSKTPQPETVEPEDECIDETVPVVEEEPTEEDGVIDVTLALHPFPGEERPVTPALEYGLVVGMSGKTPQPETVEPEDECIDETVPVVEEEPTEEDGVIDVTLTLEPFPAEERPVTSALEYGFVVGMSSSRIPQPETVEPEDECIDVTEPVVEEEPTEEDGVIDVTLALEPFPAEERPVTSALEYGLVVGMSGTQISQPEIVQPEKQDIELGIPLVEAGPTEEHVVNEVILTPESLPEEEKSVTPPLEYGLVVGMSGSKIPQPETVEPEDECIQVTVPVVEEEPTEEDGVIDVTLALDPFPGEERPVTPALEYGLVVGMSGSKTPQPETVEPEDECIDETVPVVEEEPTEEDGVIDVTLALDPFPGEERPVTSALEYGFVVGMSSSRIPQPETVEPEDECIDVTEPVVEEEPTEEDGVIDVTLALEPFPAEERPVTSALEYGLVVGMSGTQISQPEIVQPEKQDIELGIPLVEAGPTEEHVVNEVILTPESLPEEEKSVEYGLVVGMSGRKYHNRRQLNQRMSVVTVPVKRNQLRKMVLLM